MRIVATWTRWAVASGALAAASVIATDGVLEVTRSQRTLASLAGALAVLVAVEAALVLALLRTEEARLARELRTARTGTGVARGLVVRRRQRAPLFARAFSTRLGEAAVLLVDANRDAALEAMARGSVLMQGGRLDRLREVVDADATRAEGTPAGLRDCVRRLRALAPMGHREADLYRLHVLVKALLEEGDAEGALDLARGLSASDDETRVYEAWLRVWFDLDVTSGPDDPAPWTPPPPPLDEATLRLATLAARAQGAEKLVERLEERIGSVARPAGQ